MCVCVCACRSAQSPVGMPHSVVETFENSTNTARYLNNLTDVNTNTNIKMEQGIIITYNNISDYL